MIDVAGFLTDGEVSDTLGGGGEIPLSITSSPEAKSAMSYPVEEAYQNRSGEP